MHSAPSVIYPVGRSSWAGACLLLLCSSATVSMAAWTWQLGMIGWRAALGWGVCAAVGALALRSWWSSPHGQLHWDAARWQWAPTGRVSAVGNVQVALDLQHVVLLRWCEPSGAGAWLWLERGGLPGGWLAFRRAVYSRATPDGLQDSSSSCATS